MAQLMKVTDWQELLENLTIEDLIQIRPDLCRPSLEAESTRIKCLELQTGIQELRDAIDVLQEELALRQAQPKHPRHGVYVHRTKAGAIR
jgi:hypothetical protein